ncbi:hypothetical protein RRG08_007151 [Elysia crispata]|uniref:Uncharacterized protein n=1 Tax=Elysia crispata TaxID=231223 RepID=A0AAE0ZYQ5_9GAST|nr:hypothetical protein RRG08_007151 [Elysia crispata]
MLTPRNVQARTDSSTTLDESTSSLARRLEKPQSDQVMWFEDYQDLDEDESQKWWTYNTTRKGCIGLFGPFISMARKESKKIVCRTKPLRCIEEIRS